MSIELLSAYSPWISSALTFLAGVLVTYYRVRTGRAQSIYYELKASQEGGLAGSRQVYMPSPDEVVKFVLSKNRIALLWVIIGAGIGFTFWSGHQISSEYSYVSQQFRKRSNDLALAEAHLNGLRSTNRKLMAAHENDRLNLQQRESQLDSLQRRFTDVQHQLAESDRNLQKVKLENETTKSDLEEAIANAERMQHQLSDVAGVLHEHVSSMVYDFSFSDFDDADAKELTTVDRDWHPRGIVLSGTSITDSALKDIHTFDRLAILDVSNTSITDAGLDHIAKIDTLERLALDNTRITDRGFTKLRTLTNLTVLSIANTAITDQGADNLKHFKSLQYLDIENTSITDRLVETVLTLKQLKVINAHGTQLSDEAVRRLSDGLSKCTVIR